MTFVQENGVAAVSAVQAQGNEVLNFAHQQGQQLVGFVQQQIDQRLAFAQNPVQAIKGDLQAAWEQVQAGCSEAQTVLGPAWEATKEKVVEAGQWAHESVIQPTMDWAQAKQAELEGWLEDTWPGLAHCWERYKDLVARYQAFIQEKAQQAAQWVMDNSDALSEAGHLLLDGLGFIPAFGAIADRPKAR